MARGNPGPPKGVTIGVAGISVPRLHHTPESVGSAPPHELAWQSYNHLSALVLSQTQTLIFLSVSCLQNSATCSVKSWSRLLPVVLHANE